MTDKWLTIEQIADYLQVSREKIYRLCQKGKMPASKVGGQWRFDLKEVDGWVRKQCGKSKRRGRTDIKEGLSNDELELYDILKKEKMTKEEVKVKNAAKHLLHRLIKEKPKVLVQDWFRDSQSKNRVKSAIEEILNRELPNSYDRDIFQTKSNRVFDLIYSYAAMGEVNRAKNNLYSCN